MTTANIARTVRVGATVPEICAHNVMLGPGCFCPECPQTHVVGAAHKMLALLRDIENWLRPEVVKEPDRTFFWRVVDVVKEAEGKS